MGKGEEIVMLKKVASIVLLTFFGFGLGANICSEAMNPKKWVVWKKSLANQQNSGAVYKDDGEDLKNQSRNNYNQTDNERSDNSSDDDFNFVSNEKILAQEDEQENLDLENWVDESVPKNKKRIIKGK